MSRIFLTIIILCSLQWAGSAQHESLFEDVESFGAFGGPILEISSINGDLSADVGGGGAIILEECFIGGYGMGTDFPEITLNRNIGGELLEIDYDIHFGHGGLWLGYVQSIERKSHLYSSLKIGWGRVELLHNQYGLPEDRVFVLTPSAGIELNMTSFFRVALTGGYRIVSGLSRIPELGNRDFSSPTGTITFRFGGFGSYWD